MLAAQTGSLQLARALLRSGGLPGTRDAQNQTAVHYAAMGGFFELGGGGAWSVLGGRSLCWWVGSVLVHVIQALCAYGADVGVVSTEGRTALHYAAATGHAHCCKFLAQRGCSPKLKNAEGLLPRQIAKNAGHKAAAKELRRAERIVGKPGGGMTAAPWAMALHDWSHEHQGALLSALAGQSETVSVDRFLEALEALGAPGEPDQLQAVVQAHDRRREGLLSLDDFLKGGKYVQKAFLVSSYGAKKKKGKKAGKSGKRRGRPGDIPLPVCTRPPDRTPRRADGGPPLYLVETYRHCTDARRFDRDRPPRHPVEDDSAWYLDAPRRDFVDVGVCVKTDDRETLELAFRSGGVPVDVQDRFYKTPLMVACASGNYEVAQYLLQLGADVRARDQFSWTPLHHAAHAGHLELLRLLVGAGAPVDVPALNGATPLMRAIESSRPGCVDFLLQAGAKVTAENKREQHCLDVARTYGDPRVIELIKTKMDALPKPKDPRKGKRKEAPAKPRAAAALKDKANAAQTPSLAPPLGVASGGSLRASDDIILCNARITSGRMARVDISFQPRSVGHMITRCGVPGPTTSELLARKGRRREDLPSEVDLEDLIHPLTLTPPPRPGDLSQNTGLRPAE
ncbi:hypothetical protein CRUP_033399, partial [Coryphaenoides rupestris]